MDAFKPYLLATVAYQQAPLQISNSTAMIEFKHQGNKSVAVYQPKKRANARALGFERKSQPFLSLASWRRAYTDSIAT
jgi:hypothetical protein